ncbi:hypothetical protein [Baekduia sp.]|jgi:hypothetical protein|nr:hypothetical protein [Baekduia sp.]
MESLIEFRDRRATGLRTTATTTTTLTVIVTIAGNKTTITKHVKLKRR